MARVTVEDCLEKVPNRFALTVLASRRARELGEGHGSPLVECDNRDAVTSLREIGKGMVRFNEDVDTAIEGYIDDQRRNLMRSVDADHTFLDAASFSLGGGGNTESDGEDEDEDEGEDDSGVKELTGDLTELESEDDEDGDGEDGESDDDDDDEGSSDDEDELPDLDGAGLDDDDDDESDDDDDDDDDDDN